MQGCFLHVWWVGGSIGGKYEKLYQYLSALLSCIAPAAHSHPVICYLLAPPDAITEYLGEGRDTYMKCAPT